MNVGGCLILAVILTATVIGIVLSMRAGGKKAPQTVDGSRKGSGQGWKSWIGYVGVALLLGLWSIVAALFFLAIVWILRQDPQPEATFQVGDEEKKKARRVYNWLFLSSFITVPFFIVVLLTSYSYKATNNQLVLIAFTPLLFHLPLLLGLTSNSAFVYRHTQMGILLIALRAGLAAIAITMGNDPLEGAGLFLLGNGSLWLFGSIWGWVRVHRGAGWRMKQKDDINLPAREEIAPPEVTAQGELSPEESMEFSRWHLKHQRKKAAKEYALEAFRHGDAEVRGQAVQVLDELDEVGFF